MRTSFRGLLATVVAAGLAFAAPAHATQYFGFNDNSVGMRQVTPAVSAQLASDAGATSSRAVLSWRDVETTPGNVNFAVWDGIYSADIAKGIRPIAVLMNAPRWALPAGVTCAPDEDCHYAPDPSYDYAWRAIVTKIAHRYPQLAALEIWNEPNIKISWQGRIDPARYADLVKQASTAAHAVNPSLPVLASAGATYAGSDPSVGMAYLPFVRGMYQAGIKGYADGLSVHAYPRDIDYWRFYELLTEIRDVRDNAGDSQTKLWVTETGASTSDPVNPWFTFDDNSQAVLMTTLIQKLRGMPDVAGAFVHTLISPTVFPAGSSERGFGFVGPQPDLTPKPAYCAIAALNGTAYVCPSTVDTNFTTAGIQVFRWRAQDTLQSAVDAARLYRLRTGSYSGLTSSVLHAAVPSISATPASGKDTPGATADPSRILVSVWKTSAGVQNLLLCNTSQADRSYCVKTSIGAGWTYGHFDGSIGSAAVAIVNGNTLVW